MPSKDMGEEDTSEILPFFTRTEPLSMVDCPSKIRTSVMRKALIMRIALYVCRREVVPYSNRLAQTNGAGCVVSMSTTLGDCSLFCLDSACAYNPVFSFQSYLPGMYRPYVHTDCIRELLSTQRVTGLDCTWTGLELNVPSSPAVESVEE